MLSIYFHWFMDKVFRYKIQSYPIDTMFIKAEQESESYGHKAGSSKSNAFYFILLSYKARAEYWWYGSRDWTFLSITNFLIYNNWVTVW